MRFEPPGNGPHPQPHPLWTPSIMDPIHRARIHRSVRNQSQVLARTSATTVTFLWQEWDGYVYADAFEIFGCVLSAAVISKRARTHGALEVVTPCDRVLTNGFSIFFGSLLNGCPYGVMCLSVVASLAQSTIGSSAAGQRRRLPRPQREEAAETADICDVALA